MNDEEFEERAAIMQVDGGLSRWDAEEQARKILAEQRNLFDEVQPCGES